MKVFILLSFVRVIGYFHSRQCWYESAQPSFNFPSLRFVSPRAKLIPVFHSIRSTITPLIAALRIWKLPRSPPQPRRFARIRHAHRLSAPSLPLIIYIFEILFWNYRNFSDTIHVIQRNGLEKMFTSLNASDNRARYICAVQTPHYLYFQTNGLQIGPDCSALWRWKISSWSHCYLHSQEK